MELMPNYESRVVRFSVFEVDLRAGELRRNGIKVKLQNQPFQILAMLLERHGEVVTREELHSRLWSADTFVDFDNGLNSAIRRLRDALGDSAEHPTFVETLGHRGYRFIAVVEGPPARGTRDRGRPGTKQILFRASLGCHRIPLRDCDCRHRLVTVAETIASRGGH